MIGSDYLSFNFGTYLKFWENPGIQNCGSQTAVIWQSWRHYNVILHHHFHLRNSNQQQIVEQIIFRREQGWIQGQGMFDTDPMARNVTIKNSYKSYNRYLKNIG